MNFSKGNIVKSNNQITIDYIEKLKANTSITFVVDNYKEFAIIQRKSKVNINKWLLFIAFLLLLSGWVWLSEYMQNTKEPFSMQVYNIWKSTHKIVLFPLIILTFTTLFLDIIGNVNAVRFIVAFPLAKRQLYMVIVLKNNDEFEFPIKNKTEAVNIANYISS